MPVGFAVRLLIDAELLFVGGTEARLIISSPPVMLDEPRFSILVTTAIARLGSTAIAVGGPLVGTSCIGGVPGVASKSGVKSMAERLLPPELAINARARS